MKYRLFPVICAALLGLCAHANAARVYYLVGLRHVYSIPVLPDPHELDRQAIEENYTSAVAGAQKQYDTDMASIHDEEAKDGGNVHQIDRDAVQQNLEAEIADAADKREADLASLYQPADEVRSTHPEMKVDQDGPYQVIGVDTAPTGAYTNVVYYQPYPLYVEPCPFGWGWGRPYPYDTFCVQVGLFHSTWISIGAPVFCPIYYGGALVVVDAPIRREVIISREGWVGGRPPIVSVRDHAVLAEQHAAMVKAHYVENIRAAAAARPAPAVSKYSRTNRNGTVAAPSRYSRTGNSTLPPTSRYSHSTSGSSASSSTNSSRFGHSSGSAPVSKYARPPLSSAPAPKSSSSSGSKKGN